ncbi:N-acetylglucosamine-1-phosphotransferase subunits alpha/beta isoform X1 [Patella vulgata]|uniref:N-acetylglucosamine-1-phosphotransferase subunits alpha/beta isoform X1 n=1 Tax=Patella vulgata TaxID=6465 RepID=UPI0021800C62|nr:N-acetylglucosamine-1-phosphotransferase subunits alpha/beta isoform X1 [Patella vulgata]
MVSRIRKLIQKRVYDILSHKNGTLIVFAGIIIVIVSAFHFGEAVVEWSHEKYATVFNSYSDNIASKSFRTRLCLPVPIDVVYTWVNGSDPALLNQLQQLRYELQEEITSTRETKCNFHNCVPSNMIVLDPPLPKHVTLGQLRILNRLFRTASRMFVVTTPTEKKLNFTVVELDEQAVKNFTSASIIINQINITICRVFYTSDWTKHHSILLHDTVLMTGFPHTLTHTELKGKLPDKFHNSITQVKLHSDAGVAVLVVPNKTEFENLLEVRNISIDGKTPTFNAANLIWDLRDHSRGEDIASSRFEDNEELRYSIRSVVRYAPWVRHIFIVTNGQIPHWLNMDNPRLTVVTHEELFPNKTHLPTFSSPAIEAHLHRINGLSDKFIYMNDDVMFGQEVWPDDFYSQSTGHKVYLTWPVPNCNDGCPSNWIKDGYCDKACNNSECDWDAGDCEGKTGAVQLGAGFHGNYDSHAQSLVYCNTGCANTWIADRYCDTACNVKICGYDAGDCGTKDYDKLHGQDLTPDDSFYFLPVGERIGYFNLTGVFGMDGMVTSAVYNSSVIIRQVAIANKYKVLTLLLNDNHNKTLLVFSLKGHDGNKSHELWKNFTVTVDTSVSLDESLSKGGNNTSNTTSDDDINLEVLVFEEIPENERYPQIQVTKESKDVYVEASFNSNNTDLSPKIRAQLLQLETDLQTGEITEKGFKKQVNHLKRKTLPKRLNSNIKKIKNTQDAKIRSTIRKLLWKKDADESVDDKLFLNRSQRIDNYHGFPWEKRKLFKNIKSTIKEEDYTIQSFHGRKLLDTFGDSLRHVNKIYNKQFGFDSRKVPAHMPHMIDKNIMTELQDRFPNEWDETSSHQVRHSRDMQFAFSFFYYVIGVKEDIKVEDVFDKMDTDHSGVLSDREIRTLAARLYDLPLYLEILTGLENIFRNCSDTAPEETLIETVTETYYDKNMPQVTRKIFLNCEAINDLINDKFKPKNKYKFTILDDNDVAFKMIKTNVSTVVGQLDDIRKNPKKFICINDDIEHGQEEAKTVKAILQDFYESMFPIQSDFELPRDYRNRFLHVNELKEWRKYRDWLKFWTNIALVVLVIITIATFFGDKVEAMYKKYFPPSRKRSRKSSFSADYNTHSKNIINV